MKRNTFIYYEVQPSISDGYRVLLEFDDPEGEDVRGWTNKNHHLKLIVEAKEDHFTIQHIKNYPKVFNILWIKEATFEEVMIELFPEIL